jgi:hypothetical protein
VTDDTEELEARRGGMKVSTPRERRRFLAAVDRAIEHPVEVVVIGGAAAALEYGVIGGTRDIDTWTRVARTSRSRPGAPDWPQGFPSLWPRDPHRHRRDPGDSADHARGHEGGGPELQPDDSRRHRRRDRPRDRRRHRGRRGHLREGRLGPGGIETIGVAIAEIVHPLVGSTLTPVVVFLPRPRPDHGGRPAHLAGAGAAPPQIRAASSVRRSRNPAVAQSWRRKRRISSWLPTRTRVSRSVSRPKTTRRPSPTRASQIPLA